MLRGGVFSSLVLDGAELARSSVAVIRHHTPSPSDDGVEGVHEERSTGISPTES